MHAPPLHTHTVCTRACTHTHTLFCTQVRLADWGISVPLEEANSRMSVNGTRQRAPGAVGTEFWCAPEIEAVSSRAVMGRLDSSPFDGGMFYTWGVCPLLYGVFSLSSGDGGIARFRQHCCCYKQ